VQQIRTIWTNLGKRNQAIIIASFFALILSVGVLSRIATSPSMILLYAGLENGAAGDVVRSLEQRGVPYEVRGGSIYVPGGQRDELRMTLASEGLPANGGQGYELLDSLSGFSTTSQMFDAAYWRAKEGELARTIVSSRHVTQARVHIANSTANPFQKTVEPTASVSVVPSGGQITPSQANAIRFLVASAITGLSADNVAVIDTNGTVIGSPETTAAASTADDRAQNMRERVLRLVEARVGQGNAVVEISVDTVTETESIRERRFDPNGRVAISTDVEERSDASKSQSADVTVASNLPDGDGAAGDESNTNTSETRERVNYEVSETELEILRVPGAVKRLSVAVLVNGTQVIDDTGAETFVPRPDAELEALRDLVSSAVGFDADRGDVITLKSMELPSLAPQGTLVGSSIFSNIHLDIMNLIQMATLAIVTLVLGLFVIRPILSNAAQLPAPAVGALPDLAPDVGGAPSYLTGEIQDSAGGFSAPVPLSLNGGPGALPNGSGTNDAVDRLRSMIGERQEETVEILRSWLEEGEEKV
jgi:flagellar M-ring protein FliF